MTRSSFVVRTLGIGIFLLGTVACGDMPPPKPPETTPNAEVDSGDPLATSSGGEAMDGGVPVADSTPPAPAALALPSAAAKLKVEGKKKLDVEIKSDGTVNNAGKMAAKISGMELAGPDGKTALKVDGDGNIATADGAPYAKFEGDDLTTQTSTRWSIGDDGALSSTDDKGKKTAMGKSEGVGSAKRASLLAVAFISWGMKAPAPKGKKPGAAVPKK